MDINKILFEQLNNLGIQTPFSTEESSAVNDVQKETVSDENTEIKQQISSALNIQDEESSLKIEDGEERTAQRTEKLNTNSDIAFSNLLNTQNMIDVLSDEILWYNEIEDETEDEIKTQSEEYQKLAKKIEEKRAEYEEIAEKAEQGNDESIVNQANALADEINFLIVRLDEVKNKINVLETELEEKQSRSKTLNNQLNSLSKLESQLSVETAALKESVYNDAVSKTSGVVSPTQESSGAENNTPVKVETATKVGKDGVKREIKTAYNADGSYTKTTTNTETKATTVSTYDSNNKIQKQVKNYKSNEFGSNNGANVTEEITYKYNSDGSYIKTSKYDLWKVTKNGYGEITNEHNSIKQNINIEKYDAQGKEIKGNSDNYKICKSDSADSYKDYIKEKGTTYVYFGTETCPGCRYLLDAMDGTADWKGNKTKSNSADKDIVAQLDLLGANAVYCTDMSQCSQYLKQFSYAQLGTGMPVVVKFVDGKPVAIGDAHYSNETVLYKTLVDMEENSTTEFTNKGIKRECDGAYYSSVTENNKTGTTYRELFDNSGESIDRTTKKKTTGKPGSVISGILSDKNGKIITQYTFKEEDGKSKGTSTNYQDGSTEEFEYSGTFRYSNLPRKISSTRTLKDGTVLECKYEYNSDGSFQEIATNKSTGEKITTKFDRFGQKITN